MKKFVVNQIQHFSLHDGPGIRTTVFLQGCNLRCAWCHNPETWAVKPSVSYTDSKCILCGECARVCPEPVNYFEGENHYFDFLKCTNCRKCLEVCCTGALEECGYECSVDELFEDLMKDFRLYEVSGGGVTFSGGEPLLQWEAMKEICGRLHDRGVHIAVETALSISWPVVMELLEYIDLFLVDFKLFDQEKHKKFIGAGNELIINNLLRLSEVSEIAIRLPIIQNVNSDMVNTENTADFLKSLGKKIQSVELLPYHNFGAEKAVHVGLKQDEFEVPDDEQMEKLKAVYRRYGLKVV